MAPGADQNEGILGGVPDQQPVRLDMAFPKGVPLARKLVRPVAMVEPSAVAQGLDDRPELVEILATPLGFCRSRSNRLAVLRARINHERP